MSWTHNSQVCSHHCDLLLFQYLAHCWIQHIKQRNKICYVLRAIKNNLSIYNAYNERSSRVHLKWNFPLTVSMLASCLCLSYFHGTYPTAGHWFYSFDLTFFKRSKQIAGCYFLWNFKYKGTQELFACFVFYSSNLAYSLKTAVSYNV